MRDDERLTALEESLAWMRHELEQLDATTQAQAAAHDRLEQRLARIERRLERLEQGDDGAG
ncbi:MAG: SlyX family protein [Halofilum sp. (in: g-proteobacteria)]|nr:SlyX family protein [Halofilum sp. (in: g-proteobacteria)]